MCRKPPGVSIRPRRSNGSWRHGANRRRAWSSWIHRFGDALAGDWYDYLFFPINFSELRLVWSRHTAPGEVRPLQLDVDEQGRIRLTVPAQVEYQRPAVERIVEAGRSLAGLDPESAFRVRVAVGEAVANAILYGAGEPVEAHLCLPANVGDVELRAIVELHGDALRPRRLIATKVDEAVYHGSIVAAQVHAGIPYSYFTTGQRVPEDIEVASAARLAGLLCGEGVFA